MQKLDLVFDDNIFDDVFKKQFFKISKRDWNDVLLESFKEEEFLIAVEKAIKKLMQGNVLFPTNVRYDLSSGKPITRGYLLQCDKLINQQTSYLVFEKEFDAIGYVTQNIYSKRNIYGEIEYEYGNRYFLYEELIQILYTSEDLCFCRF